jgi:hypothetical protein
MKRTLYISICLFLAACTAKHNPVKPTILETELNQGIVAFYGPYYKGLAQNVASLDLYSKDITFDSLGYIQGNGTNLYVSDIFLPLSDTILSEGIYQCDTTGKTKTFLPGMDFEGNPTGTYLLQIQEATISKIILCSDSSFVYSQDGDTTDIRFNLISDKQQYEIHFRGVLKYEDRREHI